MSDALMSELDAVNTMLEAIGEAPVNSLSGTLPADVSIAKARLTKVRRQVLSKGYNFNTERDVTTSRDGSNNVVIPSTALKVELTYADSTIDVVQRGTRLYDKKNHTYVFAAAPKLDITYLLTWDELPEQARAYIALRAARIFQAGTVGSRELDGFTARDEAMALADLEEADVDSSNPNIFDSVDMQRFYSYRRRF